MRILFVTTAHNGMSQRLKIELEAVGHEVSVQLALGDRSIRDAVQRWQPRLVVAPMLKSRIPEDVWRSIPCLIVHPGIRGDRGMSSLDWAIQEGEAEWGVTILQAAEEMDAGDIWAWRTFPLRQATKSSIYGREVVEAAMEAVLEAVEKAEDPSFRPTPLDPDAPHIHGRMRPRITQADRAFEWTAPSAEILRRIRAADGAPGLLTTLLGQEVFLYDAHPEARLRGRPGAVIATRHEAICVGTGDGAVWIGHLKRRKQGGRRFFKLPATQVLRQLAELNVAEVPVGLAPTDHATWQDIRYEERGDLGILSFAFHNGAMATEQCQRLTAAIDHARSRPTRALLLSGGPDYWSNGIHLNRIEGADSPAEESWQNIQAIDDVVLALLACSDKLVVAALQGNAGAGGVMMALAADLVWTTKSVVLNPHYKSMGALYGSEYWTYLLPRRIGGAAAHRVTEGLAAMGAHEARDIGLVDEVLDATSQEFLGQAIHRVERLLKQRYFSTLLSTKRESRRRDEATKPLAEYRAEELAQMRINFFGDDPAYHQARADFVHKRKVTETPAHLAPHLLEVAERAA